MKTCIELGLPECPSCEISCACWTVQFSYHQLNTKTGRALYFLGTLRYFDEKMLNLLITSLREENKEIYQEFMTIIMLK